MAKITKHPRKSGATTVKKDNKIVGNIGKGKNDIPTVGETNNLTVHQNNIASTAKTNNSDNITSPLHMMKQKFNKLEKQPVEEIVSYDSGIMMD